MKKFISIIFILTIILIQSMFAQNNAPVVENVTFTQRDDGSFMVDIYYDVTDADGDTMVVSMQVSDDAGSVWGYSCENITGDVEDSILTGNGKHVIWDFGAEHPNTSGNQFQIKIIADDGVYPLAPVEWLTIPAGDYTYGQGDTVKTIDYDYQVSKYEITNTQYVTYLEEALANADIYVSGTAVWGYYAGDEHWNAQNYVFYNLGGFIGSYNVGRISWDGENFVIPEGYENHPVILVSWFGANAFAAHYGCSLPTDEEWEKAARGNTGYNYPWGDAIDGSRANYYNSGDPFDNGTTPAGYYNGANHGGFQTTDSPSPYGVYDMAGNIREWTNSFDVGFTPSHRINRGGDWSGYASSLQSWYRASYYPYHSSYYYGFRISRTF